MLPSRAVSLYCVPILGFLPRGCPCLVSGAWLGLVVRFSYMYRRLAPILGFLPRGCPCLVRGGSGALFVYLLSASSCRGACP